jgi:hypothetical protein
MTKGCKCVCGMTHNLPGKPAIVCGGSADVLVVATNRAVAETPMCRACADWTAGRPGFVRVEELPRNTV